MPSEEELLLLFKESGVEFVETAAKAVGELGDKMDSVNAAQQAAVDVLKEEGTVVADLEEKIGKLKRELEALADAHKAGLITQTAYKEKTDALVRVIAENETVLKRLTASETEAQAAFKSLTGAIDAQAAAEEKAASAADKLAMEANRNLIQEQERLDAIVLKNQASLERLAGEGEGEAGKGGFAGAASGAMKAEKAIHSLSSGQGLGRLGSMLEGVLGPLGLPGLGMALGAVAYELEPLVPKIKAFVDAWETGVKPINDATEAIERLNRAQGESRQKRALARIEGQITALEDKEDTQGFLSAEDTLKLRRLREAAWKKEQEAKEEQAHQEFLKRQAAAKKDSSAIDDEMTKAWKDRQKQAEHSETEAELRGVKAAQQKQKDFDEAIKFAADYKSELDKSAHAAEKQAETKAEHDARAAKTKAEHDARQNTPEAVNRREIADVGNRIMAAEQAQNQYRADMGAMPFDASELEQIKHKVMQNMPAARARGANLAQLVDWAMAMQANEIEQGIYQGLGQHDRSGQNINPRGGH